MSNILVAMPCRPDLHPDLKEQSILLASDLGDNNMDHEFAIFRDEAPAPGNTATTRIATVRNRMLQKINLNFYDYILWIDADVIKYPEDMPTRLIQANPTGVTAPMILCDTEPERFYDTSAFICKGKDHILPNIRETFNGRNLMHNAPYWEKRPDEWEVEMDCVGTITMVPTEIYRRGAYYFPHAFTEHYAICKSARNMGRKVMVCQDQHAFHAWLPDYPGEEWH